MTDYNFILIDNNKFNFHNSKLMDIYFSIKNKNKLIKPLKIKINKINSNNLYNNINLFNQKINYLLSKYDHKNYSKIKKLIKHNLNITNNIQTNIVLQIIKNIKNNYNYQTGGFIILDILGLIPAIGIPFDIISTIISLAQGDFFTALLSAAAIVPGLGTFPGIGKIGFKLLKTFSNFSSMFSSVSSFLPGDNNEYEEYDEDFDDNFDDNFDDPASIDFIKNLLPLPITNFDNNYDDIYDENIDSYVGETPASIDFIKNLLPSPFSNFL